MPSEKLRKFSICWMLVVSMGMVSIGGCAPMPAKNTIEAEDTDSLEGYNRAMYRFNTIVDSLLLKPVTMGYRYVVPQQGRQVVSNVIENLYTPVVFVNSVLQGDPQNSFATLWRFILNTTFGLGGMIDFASSAGLKNRPADFGETLAMYGVGTGSYVVLPIIGPSNARDAVGRLSDAFMDPLNYMGNDVSAALWTATAIDARSRNTRLIDDINNTSLDPYTTFRSAYTQKRASDIRRAETSREKALEQMYSK